jgi:hypothetical protein
MFLARVMSVRNENGRLEDVDTLRCCRDKSGGALVLLDGRTIVYRDAFWHVIWKKDAETQ